MEEYRQFVLAKPLSPLTKLRHLQASCEGDALKLIKSYKLGDQLQSAIEALEAKYSKPEFVCAEIYRSIKAMPAITNFNGKAITVAKTQVNTLKIGVSTLKALGFGEELLNDGVQNTFLLIEL